MSVLVDGETLQQYLGDGVYASFDGYHIWLRVEREFGHVEQIALEPDVVAQLVVYADKVYNARLDE
jgi:hypothetical protein